MEFTEYCIKKKIDPEKFLAGDPEKYKEWERLFNEVHPDSFTEQKKFLINEMRRKYLLNEASGAKAKQGQENPKPVIKPKINK